MQEEIKLGLGKYLDDGDFYIMINTKLSSNDRDIDSKIRTQLADYISIISESHGVAKEYKAVSGEYPNKESLLLLLLLMSCEVEINYIKINDGENPCMDTLYGHIWVWEKSLVIALKYEVEDSKTIKYIIGMTSQFIDKNSSSSNDKESTSTNKADLDAMDVLSNNIEYGLGKLGVAIDISELDADKKRYIKQLMQWIFNSVREAANIVLKYDKDEVYIQQGFEGLLEKIKKEVIIQTQIVKKNKKRVIQKKGKVKVRRESVE